MKAAISLIGYLAIAFTTTGLAFKLQHWPGAAVLLISGIFLLNFVFLPVYFFRKSRMKAA